MWDWSGSKAPPPVRSRDEAADEAQGQGVTPMRRDIRAVPIYRDSRAFRTLPPQAPASSGYPDPLDIQQPYQNVPPNYPQQSPYARQMVPPQAPPPYQQNYVPQQPAYPAQAPGWNAQQMPPPAYPQQNYAQPAYPQQMPPAYPQQNYAQPAYPQQMPPAYPQQAQPAPQSYSPPLPQQQQAPQPYAPQQPQSMPHPSGSGAEADRSLWEWQFQQFNLPNMDLIEAEFVLLDAQWLSELRKAFKRTRRDFLKYVGYHHVNELMAAGMDDESIKLVKKGKAPENFNIHVRVPFDYGGTNSFSNLVLIQTHPFHTELHRFLDMQTLTQPNFKPRKLFLPSPKGKVYFPGEIEISSGGQSRHDRSVYAGFLESTFEMIAQKSSLGR